MRRQMTNKGCREDSEGKLWKLIREDEVDYADQIFRRLTWVYPCGGCVEWREDLDEKGDRIYIVERFELSPKSWVEERPIPTLGEVIYVERLDDKEEALKLARKWQNRVIPCEICETEEWTVFRFKTGVKPLTVKSIKIASRVQ